MMMPRAQGVDEGYVTESDEEQDDGSAGDMLCMHSWNVIIYTHTHDEYTAKNQAMQVKMRS